MTIVARTHARPLRASRTYPLRWAAELLVCTGLLACGRTSAGSTNSAPAASSAKPQQAANALKYGKPGDPVHLVVGYQPYYTEAWSGVVMNSLGLWKKYLPPGSSVEFSIGIQGAIIVNAMLADKEQIGYLGDTPAIVGATKRSVADLRIVANIGLGHDQCNVFFTRTDAPKFDGPQAAVKWLNGKTVAVPKGSCTDRFARAVFEKNKIEPASYLNQSIELITSGFRAGKLDGAVVWEPVASRLVGEGLARRVATGDEFGENDGAFIDVRADLIEQRPDIVKGWLQAELEAELYLADPSHSHEVSRMVKEQTTGFDEPVLWRALYGAYSPAEAGSATRLTIPFGFSDASRELVQRATAFLFSVKSIAVAELPADAIDPSFTEEILKQRGLKMPVAEVQAALETAAK
jgi:NitT/TauT family transport system substrate-binding protein